MTQTPTTIYTVGHGNRTLRELIILLHGTGVQTLVDVRSFPGSHHYPHFCEENLRPALEGSGIIYHWAGRHLGEERQGKTASAHTALPTPRLRAYADHMETEIFRKGVDMLSQLAGNSVVAILGVEKSAADCHRGLIADYLYQHGLAPRHLIDSATTLQHQPHPLARWSTPYLIYDNPGPLARAQWVMSYARRRNVVRTWVMREASSPSRRSL